ncbi:MAG TPA: rhomboid family intramembrane serine protease [Fimbriimonadaceae bacterium]|nr:rhomboid family intramembrane serine protease [Fimbriimonadaceae bacterium]HRJ32298.1 rhomboid family intramembrane serine protease [Fimbriimonadaceae bacterium]
MFPLRDDLNITQKPVVTYTIMALCGLVFLWDRNWSIFGESLVFSDLACRPKNVIDALQGRGSWYELSKMFTCLFLHANWAHVLSNLIFLWAFGPSVENALGGPRFAVFYLFWGLFATATHIFVMSSSSAALLGASGAIGGVLGCYFLLFPGARIKFIIPPLFFWPFVVAAWVLLGMWFLFQIFFQQQGVANWAHAGGFLAGMLTVMILGGRARVLEKRPMTVDPEFEED